MNIASMIALLQATSALLVFAQGSRATPALMRSAVNIGSHSVQIVAQVRAPIDFAVTPNSSIWPNINDLVNAPYLDANGNYMRLGSDAAGTASTVSLLEQYTSFGDINNDGVDDAAVIVNRPNAAGTPNYFLAAMLNQGGIMFNITDYPLGNTINITTHKVISGNIMIDGKQYDLLGDQLSAANGN